MRHLRARQVLARVGLRAAARARISWPAAAARLYDGRVARADLRWRDDLLGLRQPARALRERFDAKGRDGIAAQVAAIARGHFDLVGESGELGWPPDWASPAKSQLWRYHLHYFDALLDLALAPARPFPLALELL